MALKIYRQTNLFNADTKEPEPSVRLRQVCIEVEVVISLLSLSSRKAAVIGR